MSPLAGWRPALRMARREVRRSPGRTVLVLVMIALPLLAVSIADIVYTTSNVSGNEALGRRLGTAEALVTVTPGVDRVTQGIDPDQGMASSMTGGTAAPATLARLRELLGEPTVAAVPFAASGARIRTDAGVTDAEVTETEPADPLTRGLFDLTAGRWPRASTEVTVNSALAARGPGPGEQLVLDDGTTRTVVGVAESTSFRGRPVAVGLPGAFALPSDGTHGWLIGGAPVDWTQVQRLNGVGAAVVSRAVLSDPPPASELPPDLAPTGIDQSVLTVLALVVVMVLIEVVLLAGPAFAVGARRQARTLALVAASGGTPRQARRIVLAGGVVLGLAAAAIAVLLGIVGAWLLVPAFQSLSDNRFGPFDVRWTHLAGVAAFGLISALLAAVVPARIASKQDVVTVLAGRRGDIRTSRRSPLLGVLLFGLGVAGAVYGTRAPSQGESFIAGSAILCVLGMLFLVPLVVVGVGRMAARLPLPLRFAARDAARHRTRTVPAVAAVAATVAGAVTLGIALSSDDAGQRRAYTATLPVGTASLTDYGSAPRWDVYASALRADLPDARVSRVLGVPGRTGTAGYQGLDIGVPGSSRPLGTFFASSFAGAALVSDDALPAAATTGISSSERAHAARVLRDGGVVVFSDHRVAARTVLVRAQRDPTGSGPLSTTRRVLSAAYLQVPTGTVTTPAVLSTGAARALGLRTATVGLFVQGSFTAAQARNASDAATAISADANFYVERGYVRSGDTKIVELILGALAVVLVLGGTLTATFLALADARPDLATLAAVGAAARTRRRVAASYALVVGVVGAALGLLVGLVPGIAAIYPLTATHAGPGVPSTAPVLDVPWLLLLVVVVGLPLLTAAVVGLTVRSRLPMAARVA